MPKKSKFKPVITRVKLNPEQAVLGCLCYDRGWIPVSFTVIEVETCTGLKRTELTKCSYDIRQVSS